MKIIIYDKNTLKGSFTTWGYGKLRLVEKCEVTEELNGRYDLTLIVNREDSKAKYIKKWAIVSVEGQLFRIINKIDNDKNNTIEVFAKHIFYDISYGFSEDQRAEKKNMLDAMMTALPLEFRYFDCASDITDINTIYFVKNNGTESIFNTINRWGKGELIRDNFNIKINKAKGKDNGVTFTYKKLDAIEILEDTTNVVTRLYPTGKNGIALSEKYINIPNWNDTDYPPFQITKEIKFDNAENEGDLRKLAVIEAEKIGLSSVTFTINVNDLADTSLYESMPSLMQVGTGDIVTIKHNKLDVRVKVKCVKKTKDYVSGNVKLEFGQPFKTIFESIDNGNVTVDISSTTAALTSNLNYFENGLKLSITSDMLPMGSVDVTTLAETNLMVFITGCIATTADCSLEGEIHLLWGEEEKILNFKPKMQLITGYNLLNVVVPLLFLESHTAYECWLYLKSSVNTYIEPYQLSMVLQGQQLAKGAEKPNKPEFVDRLDIQCINQPIKITESLDFIFSIMILNEEYKLINSSGAIDVNGTFESVWFDKEEMREVKTLPVADNDLNINTNITIELGGVVQ